MAVVSVLLEMLDIVPQRGLTLTRNMIERNEASIGEHCHVLSQSLSLAKHFWGHKNNVIKVFKKKIQSHV